MNFLNPKAKISTSKQNKMWLQSILTRFLPNVQTAQKAKQNFVMKICEKVAKFFHFSSQKRMLSTNKE